MNISLSLFFWLNKKNTKIIMWLKYLTDQQFKAIKINQYFQKITEPLSMLKNKDKKLSIRN